MVSRPDVKCAIFIYYAYPTFTVAAMAIVGGGGVHKAEPPIPPPRPPALFHAVGLE